MRRASRRAAVVVGPRGRTRGTSARRPNAAPVRGTRERKAVRVGEAWEGWPVTWAGPIHRSRFDMGKYERTVEGILALACCVHCHQPLPIGHLIFFTLS